ncbi:MAG TPA: hypothetical protein DEF64_06650, partial [Ruminococcaceae bacterium]|nr:hypothetical protein [Oscillospiraceae bacterium]
PITASAVPVIIFLPPMLTAFTAAAISAAVAAPTSFAVYVGFVAAFAQADMSVYFRYSERSAL